jgi:hypothetical protein
MGADADVVKRLGEPFLIRYMSISDFFKGQSPLCVRPSLMFILRR